MKGKINLQYRQAAAASSKWDAFQHCFFLLWFCKIVNTNSLEPKLEINFLWSIILILYFFAITGKWAKTQCQGKIQIRRRFDGSSSSQLSLHSICLGGWNSFILVKEAWNVASLFWAPISRQELKMFQTFICASSIKTKFPTASSTNFFLRVVNFLASRLDSNKPCFEAAEWLANFISWES